MPISARPRPLISNSCTDARIDSRHVVNYLLLKEYYFFRRSTDGIRFDRFRASVHHGGEVNCSGGPEWCVSYPKKREFMKQLLVASSYTPWGGLPCPPDKPATGSRPRPLYQSACFLKNAGMSRYSTESSVGLESSRRLRITVGVSSSS